VALGRAQSSISREITLNSVHGGYDPRKAKGKARARSHLARLQFSAIHRTPALEQYVIEQLKAGLPPKAISGRMRREGKPWYASKTAIYDWLYSSFGQRYCPYLPHKRYGRRKRKQKKTKRVMIPGRVNIRKRKRLTRWDYEGDTMVSKRSTAALVVIHNPVTMYGDARKVPNLKPHTVLLAFQALLGNVHARSLTLDNGQENRLHLRLGLRTFFCDPHAPWQKPGVENMNRVLRKKILKKSDLNLYSQAFIDRLIHTYNTTPKEKLNWKTPQEVMHAWNLFRNKKNRSRGSMQ
jgi:transposase, IS30 family